jgi:hypothetical protein
LEELTAEIQKIMAGNKNKKRLFARIIVRLFLKIYFVG